MAKVTVGQLRALVQGLTDDAEVEVELSVSGGDPWAIDGVHVSDGKIIISISEFDEDDDFDDEKYDQEDQEDDEDDFGDLVGCHACGHKDHYEEFIPTDGSGQTACPKCGSTNTFTLCEECHESGLFFNDNDATADILGGLTGGWVQRCDSCGRYKDDLEAFNAHRANLQLPPMACYPFALVDRMDASPQNAFEQRFYLRATVTKDGKDEVVEASITLRTEGDSLFTTGELARAIIDNFESWLDAAGYGNGPYRDLTVTDCGPPEQAKGF